ncbi:GntR family transcriptional regulator [Breoghania sp.]|uniref:GntR family transcriptional regulator n=1 Tax=Breoghania sp. TaxID=2065378 RepID=UPI00262D1780|nr:GntR family transcriptional regulator [Breoghania sp.]MDJ0930533.1 GntR family transcriptional regulator [Breoghania sp.]
MAQASGSLHRSADDEPVLPVKKLSLRDRAYELIKAKIISCELQPGAAVTVTDLATALGIGRTPVIQVVDRLMVDDLLQVMPRKGVVVSPILLNDLMIIEMRLINEGRAARWAAERITDDQLAVLRRNHELMAKATRDRMMEHIIALDIEFHRLISAAAGNSIMLEFLGNLHGRLVRFWSLSLGVPGQNLRVWDQHADILGALGAHDADRAETAVCSHISALRENLVTRLAENVFM